MPKKKYPGRCVVDPLNPNRKIRFASNKAKREYIADMVERNQRIVDGVDVKGRAELKKMPGGIGRYDKDGNPIVSQRTNAPRYEKSQSGVFKKRFSVDGFK